MTELSISPKRGSTQATFENITIRNFGLRLGAFGLCQDKDEYTNEHVQWMWEQYRRHVTHKPA